MGDEELPSVQNEVKRSYVFNFPVSLCATPASTGKKMQFCSGIPLLACFGAESPYVAQPGLQ